MKIHTFEQTPFVMNCYVLEDAGQALVIDPGEASRELLACLQGLEVVAIVNTHGHIDHCSGNAALIKALDAPLWCHADENDLLEKLPEQAMMFGLPLAVSPKPDRFLAAGEHVTVGAVSLEVRHVPGHSPGHIALAGAGVVFVGDVLFAGSIGRTDLPGGDYEQLMHSIRTQLMTLPEDTVVYPGHGPATTIGVERRSNPFLREL